MRLTRRAAVAGALAATCGPALARFPHDLPEGLLFFVGNSFTRQHAIPERVCRIADAAGVEAHCHPNTANGATLTDSVGAALTYASERGSPLPATVILQDHSLEPLTPEGRRRSALAMSVYAAQFERTVLFETWARRAGHRLYREADMPADAARMSEIVHAHYAEQARLIGATLAPVGLVWQHAIAAGHDLHARDGYHANKTGAHLTALVLAHALDIPLPDDPLAEIVATTPT